MTIISEPVGNIAGLENGMTVTFYVNTPRVKASGYGIVTTVRQKVDVANGVLTTPNLDPGPAKVRFGTGGPEFDIIIPNSATTVALWPLIDAGLTAATNIPGSVRNAGGISRIERITESAYEALPTPDPETFYVVFPDP